jgi:hypothetical protein
MAVLKYQARISISPVFRRVEEDHLKKRWTPSLTNGTWELSDLPVTKWVNERPSTIYSSIHGI